MNNGRAESVTIIIGAVGGVVTMLLHPGSRTPMVELLSAVAHSIAIASLPLLFIGALALTRRLSNHLVPALALTVFALGCVAAMIGTSLDGFIAPRLVLDSARSVAATGEATKALAVLTFRLIGVFTRVYVFSAAAAIALWSVAMILQPLGRSAGLYGVAMALIVTVSVGLGHLRLDVHGMTVVVVLQAIWFLLIGVTLWRSAEKLTALDEPL